jgi:hypothetical protein
MPSTSSLVLASTAAAAALAVWHLWRRRSRLSQPQTEKGTEQLAQSPFLPLSASDVAAGMRLMHPTYGYRHLMEDEIGLVQPFDFDLPTVRALRTRFSLAAHDVVIATYPKCGTTWMQQLILLLLRGADGAVAPMRDAPWLEMSASSAANGEKSSSPPIPLDELCCLPPPDPQTDRGRRIWKTHAPEPHAPWRGGAAGAAAVRAKVVVVCRNSKDAAISLLHHTKNIPPFAFVGDWSAFAPLFLDGRVESSSFWSWHEGWYRAACAAPETVLWVSFEQMKADLPSVALMVARHLGLPDPPAEELERVAERCGFSSMKAEADRRDAAAEAAGGFVKKGHMRQGKVGGWQGTMRPEEVAAFDAKDEALARSCGLRM